MAVFTLAPSRSYNPAENPLNRFRGSVQSASNSTTVQINGVDAGLVSQLNTLKSSRTITIIGSTLPNGGSITTASGTTLTLTYPYAVPSISLGSTSELLYWYYMDAPNAEQLPITYIVGSGAFTLDYLDVDGTRGTLTASSGINEVNLSVFRTLAGTTGSIIGYSRGNYN